jgi:hypothetical protein
MHLNAEELVDIAEGTRPEASAPHLARCEPCRAQLHDLRAMMSAASDVDVPEPSPLFWDHLSSRVSAAVAEESLPRRSPRLFEASEGGPRRSWLASLVWKRGLLDPLLAVGAVGLLIAVGLSSRATPPVPAPASANSIVWESAAPRELVGDSAVENDASLTLVASLTDDADLETAREAGLVPRGSAEHAVTHMSDAELRELRRLLTEELARPGA